MTPEVFKIVKFSKQFYPTYKSWFEYPSIAKTLGHIDEEWLNFILKDKNGTELALINTSGQLLGVIGLVFPTAQHNYYVITNLAVSPKLQNQGIGTTILNLLNTKYRCSDQQYWLTFIAIDNKPAQAFFAKNGWISMGQEGELLRYQQIKPI